LNIRTLLLAGTTLSFVTSAQAQDFAAEYANQWGLEMIGVEAAWNAGLTGQGVLVGVTDTGLELGAALHPEFIANYSGLFFDGYGDVMTDTEGHGTHVAGIIAAARDGEGMVGVAYNASLVPLRLLNGPTPVFGSDQEALAFEAGVTSSVLNYGLDNGVRIFNASWGSPGGHADTYAALQNFNLLDTAVAGYLPTYRRLAASDAVIVYATGNSRADGVLSPGFDAALPFYFPELLPAWLAVTSVNRSGDLAWYAQPCEVAAMWCLTAPGGDTSGTPEGGIYSTVTGGAYEHYQGTSMAAPHVTGALALARELFPNARLQDLSRLLLNTATDIGDAGIDGTFGWGLLNVTNMVGAASPQAGAIFAQSSWAQATTVDRVIDQVSARHAVTGGEGTPFWFTPFGGFGGLSSDLPDLSGSYAAAGIIGGADLYRDADWQAGITLGMSSHGFTGDTSNTLSDGGFHAGGYLGYDNSHIFADLTLGASLFTGNTTRDFPPGLAGTVLDGQLGNSASHVDSAFWGNIQLGTHLAIGNAALSPYAFGRATHQSLAGVVEQGNNALVLDVASATSTHGEIGFGFELAGEAIALEGFSLTPSLDLAYGRALGEYHARQFDLLGNTMEASTDGLGDDILHIGAALSASSDDGTFNGRIGYQGDIRFGAAIHTVSASFSKAF
jgi:subtilase-type serine protease